MSYMICPKCGGHNGMVGSQIFQCACVSREATTSVNKNAQGFKGLIAKWRKWADKVHEFAPSFGLQASGWLQCADELEKFIATNVSAETLISMILERHHTTFKDDVAQNDGAIDTSDIPEVKDWSGAVRGKFYHPVDKNAAKVIIDIAIEDTKQRGYELGLETAAKHRPMDYHTDAGHHIRCQCGAKFFYNEGEGNETGFLAWEQHIRDLAKVPQSTGGTWVDCGII